MDEKPQKDTLGERLKQARKDAGLSQKELAAKLNITDKAVSTYEVGRAHPSFQMMKHISRLTNKPLAFFDEDVDITKPNIEEKLDSIELELKKIRELFKKSH